ncbi:hypothetical protein ACFL54_05150, partial [Planctomycetota bacterium]
MRLERSISANYVDRTRAVFAAESGVEAAVAMLGEIKGGVLSPEGYAYMLYNPDDPDAPLPEAAKPSFKSMQSGPGGIPISGAVSDTNVANGDYFLLKVEDDTGKLNLNDSNALMDPNDDTSGRLFHVVSNLAEILFAADKGQDIGTVVASNIFDERDYLGRFSMLSQIEDVLKSMDFTSQECRKFLSKVTLWSWQDPDVIKPIPAWGTYDDAKTLYGDPPDDGFPKYGFPFMRWEEVQSFNDGDDANGIHNRGYQLEPRCPVNVNTASKELIQSLLAGLEGWTVFEGPSERYQRFGTWGMYYGGWCFFGLYKEEDGLYGYPNYLFEMTPRASSLFHQVADKLILDDNSSPDFKLLSLPFARLRRTKIPNLMMDEDFSASLAGDLYDRIHGLGIYAGNPNPIENWREFKFYLDSVIQRAKTGDLLELAIDDPFAADESEATWTYDRTGDFQYFNEYYRDLILANFDPNTMTNDFNPDLVVYRHTDKADLITYTTEFCFEPTGAFSIESLGRVLGARDANPVQAEQGIAAVVKIFEFKRLTTQAQLVSNDTSIVELDEQFGRNESSTATKWGSIVGYDNGARLVSHPEPLVENLVIDSIEDKFGFVKKGIFDGRIGLSPIKHITDGYMGGLQEPASLWGYFAGSMNCHNQAGPVPPGLPSEADTYFKFNTPDAKAIYAVSIDTVAEELRASENPLMTRDPGSGKPGTLYVDGIFSEAWKCPAYPPSANGVSHLSIEAAHFQPGLLEGGKQTLLMSLKPGFAMKDSNRSRNFLNMGQGDCYSGYNNILSISRLQHDHLGFGSSYGQSVWKSAPPDQDQHPLAFGFGYAGSCRARGIHFPRTNFVRTDLDLDRGYSAFGRTAYHFEGRRWNIIAASWDFANNQSCVSLNGQQADYDYRSNGYFYDASTLAPPFTIVPGGDEQFKAPIRLGAFARPQGIGNDIDVWNVTINLHEPADTTFGEFIFFKEALPEGPFQIQTRIPWEEGFYYHDFGEPAAYTTPEINLSTKPGKAVTIRSISWTGHWPQYVCSEDVVETDNLDPVWGNSDYTMPRWMDMNSNGSFDFRCADLEKYHPKYWDPFTVDIFANDKWLYAEAESDPWMPPQTPLSYSGGSMPLDIDGYKLTTEYPIRLKFYFNLAEDQVEPLRESPYLDDITITYIPAQRVKFLYYQMH